ncbi:hypothetical protein [Chryseobacterium wanjuense]
MKKLILLMIGLGFFAVSCKKQETQVDKNSVNDSMTTNSSVSPMDTTTVRDSSMNETNQTGTNTNATTVTPSGAIRTDSVK